MKLLEGGWFPLLIAAVIAFLMLTWRTGLILVEQARAHLREEEGVFIGALDDAGTCLRTDGIGAFLSASVHGVPLSLSHHVRHNRAVQKRLVLISVQTLEMPFVGDDERALVRRLADGIDRVILRYGFMEDLAIPEGLATTGLFTAAQMDDISYYIGRETVIVDRQISGMAPWRELLFVSMQRNTAPTGSSFCIPSSQLVEIGTEVRI